MYHVELRQFPHNMCRFNLDERALAAILDPWVSRRVVEFGERKWNPEQARLRVLDGPSIPLTQLTMGRGWRTAERQSTDVTEQLLAEAERGAAPAVQAIVAGGSSATPAATPTSPGASPVGDQFALGMHMAALLGPDAMRLLEAWHAAGANSPGLAPSETLALAEAALRAG
jgi:hypothetical protein